MIKIIRRHQKKFLAGLTIFSMVAFLVQRGSSGQGSTADPVYGTMDGKKIYVSEIAQAKAELQALAHSVRYTLRDEEHSMLEVYFGPEMTQALLSKPELFVLLTREADKSNIQISSDEVESVMVNQAKDLDKDSDTYAAAKAGVTDVYKILTRFNQVASAVKVSKPMLNSMLAKEAETLQMNLVQVNASDFLAKVPAPTTQQVQDQFSKFAAIAPNRGNASDPFGFGYKLPMRSKVQYLRVSIDSVAAAVIATKSNYDWEVAARKYYLNSPDEFAKPATTAPTTAPVVMLPQTFEQAHDQVLKTIRTPMIAALTDQVVQYLSSTMNADYQTYLQYCTAGKGGTEPDSSLGVKYSSVSYIYKLVDAVQSRFKVAIVGTETPDFLSMSQIGGIPGVGTTRLTSYLSRQATAYLSLQEKTDPTAPGVLMKPSGPISDSDDPSHLTSVAFARLSGVLPAQARPDIAGIQSQVEADVRMTEAYQMAKDQAAALQTAAKAGNLTIEALATGRSIIPVQGENAVSMYTGDVKGVYPPLGDSAESFMKQAFAMSGSFDPKSNPHPVQTIELPEQRRLFVAQLTDVNASWDGESYYRMAAEFSNEAAQSEGAKVREGWFNYDAVAKRVGFKPIK